MRVGHYRQAYEQQVARVAAAQERARAFEADLTARSAEAQALQVSPLSLSQNCIETIPGGG